MIRMPHKEPLTGKPTKGPTGGTEETQRFESVVSRLLNTAPKPHGKVAKKEPGKKAGPKLLPKK